MATKEELRELLRQEIAPLKLETGQISRSLDDLKTTVSFLSKKYDDLLGQYNGVAEKLSHQSSIIEGLKNDIQESRKTANEAVKQAEELPQYIRRDCLEIAGIAPNKELTCKGIVRSVGNAIGVAVSDTDISVTHPIPSFNTAAPPKLIVKFTRREVRDRFYSNRKNLARKQIKDIPGLRSDGRGRGYIAGSLMPSQKMLFGEINKMKKSKKWKFIWMQNGRIFLREAENTRIYGFDTKEGFC